MRKSCFHIQIYYIKNGHIRNYFSKCVSHTDLFGIKRRRYHNNNFTYRSISNSAVCETLNFKMKAINQIQRFISH
jgi:hypothetical protein